jgi:3-hydroxybutyrate dehydrogenase
MTDLDFSHKTVLVTGGSSGIGFAIASAFASRGADVKLLAVDAGVSGAASRIRAATGGTVTAFQADIADAAQVMAALSEMASVDVLINNAGFGLPTPISDRSPEGERAFRRVVDVNLIGTYLVTRETLPRMPNGGRIVITGSIVGRGKHLAGLPAYAASKAGLQGLTQALAVELGPRRITVNCVCPGITRVPWMVGGDAVFELEKATFPSLFAKGLLTKDTAEDIASMGMVAGDGLLEPESLVPAYLFLASAAAGDITGQCLHVDRGDVMR